MAIEVSAFLDQLIESLQSLVRKPQGFRPRSAAFRTSSSSSPNAPQKSARTPKVLAPLDTSPSLFRPEPRSVPPSQSGSVRPLHTVEASRSCTPCYDVGMKSKPKTTAEYTNFSRALGKVLRVSHSELQSRIEAAKKARKQRRARTSARASGDKG